MSTTDSLSQKFLEVLPPIIHHLRTNVGTKFKGRLSIPQLRILASIDRGMVNVGLIASAQGVAQPTTSKMVDGLVVRGLIKRNPHPDDRRQIILALTKKGETSLNEGRGIARHLLKVKLGILNATERADVEVALKHLQKVFTAQKTEIPPPNRKMKFPKRKVLKHKPRLQAKAW